MLFLIVVCKIYDTHELKMVGRILRGIRVEKNVDGTFRGKRVENKCKDTIRNELNSIGFAREKAQTMSFVERGFERLGLGYQVVGFSWCSYVVMLSSLLESFS